MLAVILGWVVFRAESLSSALGYGLSLFGLSGNAIICGNAIGMFRDYWVFLFFGVVCSTPVFAAVKERLQGKSLGVSRGTEAFSTVFYVFILVWSFSFIVIGSHNPFIYFNF
jgi:hypothetical protein